MSTPRTLRYIDDVALRLTQDRWAFSDDNAAAISVFWQRERIIHPHYFNGPVHVLRSWGVREFAHRSTIVGELMRTDFASFLYWREQRGQARSEFDFSGAGAVVCEDGALLLVLSGEHTIAPGTLEFPSGLVDSADFHQDGRLNYRHHVEREVSEELSLTPDQIGRPVRYLASHVGETVQAVSIFRVRFESGGFIERWRSNVAKTQSEIGDIVALHDVDGLKGFKVPPHVEAAASLILADIRNGTYGAPS